MRTTNVLICMVALFGVALFTASAQAGTISYRDTVLEDNPIVYYAFDETSGSTADNIGSSDALFDGTIMGDTSLGQSSFSNGGTSFYFDGSGDYVALPAVNYTEWTVEAWAKIEAGANSAMIFSMDSAGYSQDVQIGLNPDGPQSNSDLLAVDFQTLNPNQFHDLEDQNSPPTTVDTWHHVVVTGSDVTGGDELKFYLNGALMDSTTLQSTQSIELGGVAHTEASIGERGRTGAGAEWFWLGNIDEVALYDTPLSADRIKAHYDAGVAVVPEPSSFALAALGLLGLLAFRRRRR